jgi:hypothetical protein
MQKEACKIERNARCTDLHTNVSMEHIASIFKTPHGVIIHGIVNNSSSTFQKQNLCRS